MARLTAGIGLLILSFYGQRTLPADLLAVDPVAVAIFAVGFVLLRWKKPNPIWVMAGAGAAGVVLYSLF